MTERTETTLKQIVEGLIFAADEPITPKQVRELIEDEPANGSGGTGGLTPQKIHELVGELNDDYERSGRPYRIQAIAGGYIFATDRNVASYVGKLHKEQSKRRLTQAALETLAIIAYKQPMTKVELETIRGVNSDYIVRSLLEKDLIAIVGREQTPGRPLLYGTTKRFLMHFGLNSVNELPKPREIEELIGETELEVEKRLLEMQKEKQDEDEEAARKRERKPHPISDRATAKIIPLKPDYRPVRRKPPEPETPEPAEDEPADTTGQPPEEKPSETVPQPPEEKPAEKITQPPEDKPEETTPPPVEQKPAEEERVERPPVREDVAAGADRVPAEIAEERGWKKWKNKITKIIKKIFG